MGADKESKFYEMITLNTQKGEAYIIKFKENPVTFVGIPILSRNTEGKFSCQVIEPEDQKGMIEGTIDEIEFMEKVPR